MERLWNGLFGKNYFAYWSNHKPNEAGQLERDNVSLSELIAYKTSGQLPSWWVGIQNHVGIFRYSYWMFCNLSVKFAVQNFTNTLNVAGHCGDTFLQFFFGLVSWESLNQILRQLVKFIYLTNLFKEDTFA